MKGLLEIKEDWTPAAFQSDRKPEAVSIDTGSLRIEFQKNPWKYTVYDKQGQIVLQEHVKDVDTQGNFRGLPLGFHHRETANSTGPMKRSLFRQDESFYGLGERYTKLNKLGLRVNGWLANAWGAGTDDTYKAIPFLMSTRRLRNFRQHDLPQSMGHRQPFGGVLHISDRRSATGFLHHLRPELSSKCWLAMRRSPAGRRSRPKNPSVSGSRLRAAQQERPLRWRWRRNSGKWISRWISSRTW